MHYSPLDWFAVVISVPLVLLLIATILAILIELPSIITESFRGSL